MLKYNLKKIDGFVKSLDTAAASITAKLLCSPEVSKPLLANLSSARSWSNSDQSWPPLLTSFEHFKTMYIQFCRLLMKVWPVLPHLTSHPDKPHHFNLSIKYFKTILPTRKGHFRPPTHFSGSSDRSSQLVKEFWLVHSNSLFQKEFWSILPSPNGILKVQACSHRHSWPISCTPIEILPSPTSCQRNSNPVSYSFCCKISKITI